MCKRHQTRHTEFRIVYTYTGRVHHVEKPLHDVSDDWIISGRNGDVTALRRLPLTSHVLYKVTNITCSRRNNKHLDCLEKIFNKDLNVSSKNNQISYKGKNKFEQLYKNLAKLNSE